MPLPEPSPRSLQHKRKVTCEGFERRDGLWDIEATLLDTKTFEFPNHEKNGVPAGDPIHHMQLRLTLDLDFLIHEVAVAMDSTPFGICRQVERNIAKISGLQIGPGWLRKVRERVPKTDGCTHLLDLLNPIATVAYQSMHLALEARAKASDNRSRPPIIDQCLSLASHSTVVKVKWPEFYEEPSSKTT